MLPLLAYEAHLKDEDLPSSSLNRKRRKHLATDSRSEQDNASAAVSNMHDERPLDCADLGELSQEDTEGSEGEDVYAVERNNRVTAFIGEEEVMMSTSNKNDKNDNFNRSKQDPSLSENYSSSVVEKGDIINGERTSGETNLVSSTRGNVNNDCDSFMLSETELTSVKGKSEDNAISESHFDKLSDNSDKNNVLQQLIDLERAARQVRLSEDDHTHPLESHAGGEEEEDYEEDMEKEDIDKDLEKEDKEVLDKDSDEEITEEEVELKTQSVRNGWTLNDVGKLTVGELFIMVSDKV